MANWHFSQYWPVQKVRGYIYAALFVGIATVLRWLAPGTLSGTPYLTFYPACIFSAILGGFGPGLFAVLTSWACVNLLFGDVPGHINIADPLVFGRLLIFVIGGLGVSLVSEWRLRAQQNEKTAKEAALYLSSLVESSEEAIIGKTLEGTITSWNEGAERLYGYSAEEAIGKPISFLIPSENPNELTDILRRVASGSRIEPYETERRHKDGHRLIVSLKVSPIVDASGEIIGASSIAHDITDRKQAEAALRESEERVRAKLESIVSPEGDIGALELGDIIDIPELQTLFHQFHAVTHIPVAIVDVKGKVLIGAGWQDICTKYHRVNPESCQHCIESDRELSADIPAGQYKLYHCKNHMWDAATPIIVGNKHLGSVFSGQFFFEDESPDVALFREQADRFGFSETAYLGALERVPRLSRETVSAGMAFLMKLADMISKLSYSNLKLARSLAERDRLTAALTESEQQLRTVLNALPVGVIICNETGRIVQANEAANSIWGGEIPLVEIREFGRFRGRQPGNPSLFQPEEWALTRALRHGETVLSEEIEIETFDGARKTILNNALPIRSSTGEIVGGVAVNVDITGRKETEKALIRSEKLASVGRMAATIAHEVNNPLAAVMNALFLVGSNPHFPPAARSTLDLAVRELERAAHMTKQTLGFYKEKAGVPGSIQLSEILDETLELYGPKLKNNRVTVARRYAASGAVYTVEGETRQIVSNLVANSIDAMPQNGMLYVRTAGPFTRNGRPMISVTIADTGEGIAPEHLGRIFEPFFTTKQSIGTGLGLWVTRELVNKNDGDLRVHSRLGRGTVFVLWLPQERRLDQRSRIF